MKHYETADHMMLGMVADILTQGYDTDAREMETIDFPGWSGVLDNPRARVITNPARGMRTGYPAASVAWNLAEYSDVDSICWWNPNGAKISDDGSSFYGANYGERWTEYLDEAIELIRGDRGTRRAWVPIWMPKDSVDYFTAQYDGVSKKVIEGRYSRMGKDVPCTLGFGLRVMDDDSLDIHVLMRSQSAWGVFPYDIYLFTVMQELIANELSAGLGKTYWSCISAHVYARELDWIAKGKNSEPDGLGEMEPIGATLGEARIAYPLAFDDLTGQSADMPPMTQHGLDDPIIDHMIRGAKEIVKENAAGVRS